MGKRKPNCTNATTDPLLFDLPWILGFQEVGTSGAIVYNTSRGCGFDPGGRRDGQGPFLSDLLSKETGYQERYQRKDPLLLQHHVSGQIS